MVMLYAKGQMVGNWADSEKLVSEIESHAREFELRDETGKLLGRVVPASEPICPWEPDLTKEDIDRRIAAGGGSSLADFWKKSPQAFTFGASA
jgi:hypothetical protein